MLVVGQWLRCLFYMSVWPSFPLWGFGELYPWDGTFFYDEGATDQINLKYAPDPIISVYVSEVGLPFDPPSFRDKVWIDIDPVSGDFVLQEIIQYNPPYQPIRLYPVDHFWSCAAKEP